jgi:hypothetical protein
MKATLGLPRLLRHLALLLAPYAFVSMRMPRRATINCSKAAPFLDDCAFCDRLSIAYPMRGEFDLVPLTENSLSSRYSVTNLQFFSGPSAQPVFKLPAKVNSRSAAKLPCSNNGS